MSQTVLGLDISKKDFHAVLIKEEKTSKARVFSNHPEGFTKLQAWLSKEKVSDCHVGLEATSTYGEAVAEFLHELGYRVSIINPSRVKGFAKSEMLRLKNDRVDAGVIARFTRAVKPEPWTPLPVEVKELQALRRRLESLLGMQQQERNRLETATFTVAPLIEAHLAQLEELMAQVKQLIGDHFDQHPHLKQQRELLVSIPGIGEQTAALLLAEIGSLDTYDNARQLAAHAGLTPSELASGSSVKGKSRLSKVGNSRLRKALYLPALCAMRHNPLLKAFAQRLLERGKLKMQVIGALMRKLLHLAYGILKSQRPFDPLYLSSSS